MFSCEFCKISMNTFFTEHLRVTAFGKNKQLLQVYLIYQSNYSWISVSGTPDKWNFY